MRIRDAHPLSRETDIAAFARKHDLAMLMPMGCPAKDHGGDIDVDPNHGLGRSLLTAVDQLSVTTNHPELKTASLIVLGFSGAGALVGRLVGFAPDRIEAAILSHAGQVPPLNLRYDQPLRCRAEDSGTGIGWWQRRGSGDGSSLFVLL